MKGMGILYTFVFIFWATIYAYGYVLFEWFVAMMIMQGIAFILILLEEIENELKKK